MDKFIAFHFYFDKAICELDDLSYLIVGYDTVTNTGCPTSPVGKLFYCIGCWSVAGRQFQSFKIDKIIIRIFNYRQDAFVYSNGIRNG